MSQNSWWSFSPAARYPDCLPVEAAPEDEASEEQLPCPGGMGLLATVLPTSGLVRALNSLHAHRVANGTRGGVSSDLRVQRGETVDAS